jgi:hypothetical protein
MSWVARGSGSTPFVRHGRTIGGLPSQAAPTHLVLPLSDLFQSGPALMEQSAISRGSFTLFITQKLMAAHREPSMRDVYVPHRMGLAAVAALRRASRAPALQCLSVECSLHSFPYTHQAEPDPSPFPVSESPLD